MTWHGGAMVIEWHRQRSLSLTRNGFGSSSKNLLADSRIEGWGEANEGGSPCHVVSQIGVPLCVSRHAGHIIVRSTGPGLGAGCCIAATAPSGPQSSSPRAERLLVGRLQMRRTAPQSINLNASCDLQWERCDLPRNRMASSTARD